MKCILLTFAAFSSVKVADAFHYEIERWETKRGKPSLSIENQKHGMMKNLVALLHGAALSKRMRMNLQSRLDDGL